MIYVLPNSDVLIMESVPQQSQSRIVLLRDSAKRGRPDLRQSFLRRLNMAFGMTLIGNRFYVGNTDGVVVLPYSTGETRIQRRPEKILDLPSGGHYTRNLLADSAGKKIYVAVGSASNVDEQRVDEKDPRRAAILQVNPDGSGMRVFASGMRNPVGMDWEMKTNRLWTVVNERDMLGDELVPDYLTSVRDGAFYGWPYSYFGQNEDPRKKGQRPDLVAKAVKPDYALGSHVAPLGLVFYNGKTFPEHYHGGAFIGMIPCFGLSGCRQQGDGPLGLCRKEGVERNRPDQQDVQGCLQPPLLRSNISLHTDSPSIHAYRLPSNVPCI